MTTSYTRTRYTTAEATKKYRNFGTFVKNCAWYVPVHVVLSHVLVISHVLGNVLGGDQLLSVLIRNLNKQQDEDL